MAVYNRENNRGCGENNIKQLKKRISIQPSNIHAECLLYQIMLCCSASFSRKWGIEILRSFVYARGHLQFRSSGWVHIHFALEGIKRGLRRWLRFSLYTPMMRGARRETEISSQVFKWKSTSSIRFQIDSCAGLATFLCQGSQFKCRSVEAHDCASCLFRSTAFQRQIESCLYFHCGYLWTLLILPTTPFPLILFTPTIRKLRMWVGDSAVQ